MIILPRFKLVIKRFSSQIYLPGEMDCATGRKYLRGLIPDRLVLARLGGNDTMVCDHAPNRLK